MFRKAEFSRRFYIVSVAVLLFGIIIGVLIAPTITGLVSAKRDSQSGPFIIQKPTGSNVEGPSTRNFNVCYAESDRMHSFCCLGWADWKVRQCETLEGRACEVIDLVDGFGSCGTIGPMDRTDRQATQLVQG